MVKKILSALQFWLRPHSQVIQTKIERRVNVQEAIKIALVAKCQTDSEATRRTFTAQVKMFTYFSVTEKLHQIDVREFGKLEAVQYLDHVSETRTLSNRTYNGYLMQICSLFGEIKHRGLIDVNPFVGVPHKKDKLTTRRPFTPEEAQIVGDYLLEFKPMLFIAILLEHYCLIRPAELRRLRLSAFDFQKSVIRISADVSKTNTERVVTIPLSIWEHLTPFAKFPANYYLFGAT